MVEQPEAQLKDAVVGGNLVAVEALLDLYLDSDPPRISDAEVLIEDVRSKMEIGGALIEIRRRLALRLGRAFVALEMPQRAAVWALRGLLDGPSGEAFRILSWSAERLNNTHDAVLWIALAERLEDLVDREITTPS